MAFYWQPAEATRHAEATQTTLRQVTFYARSREAKTRNVIHSNWLANFFLFYSAQNVQFFLTKHIP